MSSPSSPKPIAFQLKKLSAAVALALMFSTAGAAGWGDLTVMSSLGQPLRAEIELISASRQDDGPLTVKLASFDAYRQANIEFNPALMSLRFAVEQRGGRQFVRVTSTQPLNEPFVDMLLELSSASGRIVREYVFLLDPAGFDGSTQMAVVAPVQGDAAPVASSAAAPAGASKPATPAAAKPARKTARAPAPAREAAAQANTQRAAPAAGKPRLTLSGVTATSATDDKAGVIVLEDYAAMERSVAEANARVKALEQKVADLQKLLEVTNSLLAELQKQNELAKAGATPAAPAPAAAVQPAAPANAEAGTAGPATPAAAPVPAPAPAAAPAAAPAPAAPKPVTPPPVAETDTSDYLLPGAAFLVALLGAAGIYVNRRRKAQKPFEAGLYEDTAGDKTTTQYAGAGDAMTTALGTDILLPTGHGRNHEVDPLAEADVYIAYGRDVQAEEILKEALRKQSDRHSVRVKLLSIYAGRKDAQSFETLARELYGMTGGEGDDWKQAAELGREIDPGNPLYAPKPPREEADAAPSVSEQELVLERIAGDEPAAIEAGQPIAGETLQKDVALPDLTPTEEIAPAAFDALPGDTGFDLDAPGGQAAQAPAAELAEPRESGPGPIDFDFLKPVDIPQETPQESVAAIPELPTAALGESTPGESLLEFDFLKPEPGTDAVPEIPPALLDEPRQEMQADAKPDDALLDFDFLKPEAGTGESEEDARKRTAQPNS